MTSLDVDHEPVLGDVFLLELPYLVAGRDLADLMLDKFEDLTGRTVVVDARRTATGSPSFSSQLVHRVLERGDAASLVLLGAPDRFADQVSASALDLGVSDRLTLTSVAPTGLADIR